MSHTADPSTARPKGLRRSSLSAKLPQPAVVWQVLTEREEKNSVAIASKCGNAGVNCKIGDEFARRTQHWPAVSVCEPLHVSEVLGRPACAS